MKVLLANECGAGSGHLVNLARLAERLRTRGAACVLAAPRLADTDRYAARFETVVQAPVWPLMFRPNRRDRPEHGPSYATLLANMGFDEPATVTAILRAWAAILDHLRPDVVVGEYAPGALLAARGRCATAQVGYPFYTPAIDGDTFPPFLAEDTQLGVLEPGLLASIQEALERLGRPPIPGLGALLGDASLPAAFAEFDCCRDVRGEPLLPPIGVEPVTAPRDPAAACLYSYLADAMERDDVVMATLCALKVPRKVFMWGMSDDMKETLTNRGVEILSAPPPGDLQARDARLHLHHGGGGTTQIALAAGVPQLILAADMEKRLNGRAVETFGAGRTLPRARLTLPVLRDAVLEMFEDDALQERAAAAGVELRRRMEGPHAADIAAERVLALARRGVASQARS